jgi:hypothetical protein
MTIESSAKPNILRGVLGNKFQFSLPGEPAGDQKELVFSRRFSGNLEELAKLLGVEIHVPEEQPVVTTRDLQGQLLG